MLKISSNDVEKYLVAGKELISNAYEDVKDEKEYGIYLKGIEIGISKTIAALYDADVDDNEIIQLLNKHWNINMEEAENRLRYEKEQAAIRELKLFMKRQGYSKTDINEFMKSNKVSPKIRHSNELWKLRRKPENLMKKVQEEK